MAFVAEGYKTSETGCITLDSGATEEVNMALTYIPHAVSISGFVWADNDENGFQDAGEPVISGATVSLLDCGGDSQPFTQTDINGNYGFTDLAAGDYSVEFSADGFETLTTGCNRLLAGETWTVDAGLVRIEPYSGDLLPEEAINEQREDVRELMAERKLKPVHGAILMFQLKVAVKALERQKPQLAVGLLKIFKKTVNCLVRREELDPVEGRRFVDNTDWVIDQLKP
jgi:hypothetical protein